MKTWI